MLPTAPDLAHIALVGIGATAVLDAWLWLLLKAWASRPAASP